LIDPVRRTLELSRVVLRGIEEAAAGAQRELARRIGRAAPQLDRGAIALIDSPRWPVDLDWSQPGVVRRADAVTGRAIDRALQGLVKELRRAGARTLILSMFPTPRLDYFTRQIAAPGCKPHLRAFGQELLGPGGTDPGPPKGGSFTRFMLVGFAAYQALAPRRVTRYEGFPDLQFRLWSGGEPLPSKMKKGMRKADRAAALDARRRLVAALADRLDVGGAAAVSTLDQADAAILALSVLAAASADCGLVVEAPAEGRFWLTLPAATARLIQRRDD
jgi:hypothetical protein